MSFRIAVNRHHSKPNVYWINLSSSNEDCVAKAKESKLTFPQKELDRYGGTGFFAGNDPKIDLIAALKKESIRLGAIREGDPDSFDMIWKIYGDVRFAGHQDSAQFQVLNADHAKGLLTFLTQHVYPCRDPNVTAGIKNIANKKAGARLAEAGSAGVYSAAADKKGDEKSGQEAGTKAPNPNASESVTWVVAPQTTPGRRVSI